MKANLAIKMLDLEDCNKINFYKYQHLISKLIYLLYRIRYNIIFDIDKLSKHNVSPRKR